MCGICGIVMRDREPVDPALLQGMNDVIRHRGPDGEGFFVRENVGLAMRRLAIIDVAGGWQPIYDNDRSLVIVFNGEIYNYRDLMTDLERRGHHFATRCDTE